jgi:transcriptional regulator with XRE-family HTH domain
MIDSSKNSSFLKFRNNLGENVQKLRKERGLSQEELASLVGIDRVAIGYIEQGIRSPKLETTFSIAKALKVKPKDLFDF